MNFNKMKTIKVLGLAGAFIAGFTMILNGQLDQGVGVIAASLASANIASN